MTDEPVIMDAVRPAGVLDTVEAVAVVVARGGQLPLGGAEAVAEAGGGALVVGSGAERAAADLADTGARRVWFSDTGPGLRVGALAMALAPALAEVGLVVLPASPDGRDLAPRLAAVLGRPLLAGTVAVRAEAVRTDPSALPGPRTPPGASAPGVRMGAVLSRLEDRLQVEVTVDGPVVATLLPGVRAVPPPRAGRTVEPSPFDLALPTVAGARGAGVLDVEVLDVLEPDPATMDLSEATRVLGGGAGLVARGCGDAASRASFDLLGAVAAALGASAGATRVVTDAGWMGYDRQIGTTGVAVDPDLYVAFGISGASQHTGGLGAPRHVVSVNTDPSCPMTAMADLGLVTDAAGLLVELARRLDVPIPDDAGAAGPDVLGNRT